MLFFRYVREIIVANSPPPPTDTAPITKEANQYPESRLARFRRRARASLAVYRARLYLLFLLLILVLGGVGYGVLEIQRYHNQQLRQLETVFEQMQLLDELLITLLDAETGERGFVITGEDVFLQPYYRALGRIEHLQNDLRTAHAENAAAPLELSAVEESVAAILQQLELVITAVRNEGSEVAAEMVRGQSVKREMDKLRTLIRDWRAHERQELVTTARRAERTAVAIEAAIVGGFVLSCLFLLLTAGLIRREVKQRAQSLVQLTESRDQLSQLLERQGQLLKGREQLRQFTERLQTCHNLEEAQTVLAGELPRLVPLSSGALAVQNPSRVYLEVVHSWGPTTALSVPVFEPSECYSLRRGRPLWCNDPVRDPCCNHLNAENGVPLVCYPLTAHNQVLGCLMAGGEELPNLTPEERDLLAFAAETFSMVLSQLMLDQSLRYQAVHDPLTGLFNRRHMEATLERELARTKRKGDSLTLLMLDVDHFKQYNDTHGHDAADRVLQELGKILASDIRTEDVACRYGGEEFLVVLPGIDADTALARARQIHKEAREMRPNFHHKVLPGITLSLGLAIYPRHGSNADALIHAADQALYRAKRNGRDRIELADTDPKEERGRE